jgi:regulation of enolase protein 1 (concanavalin A-like superfamily)
MSARTIRHALFSSLILFALCAAAPRAHADERLCDPSFQNCRDGTGNLLYLIDHETERIDVAFWFMEDSRYASHIIAKWNHGAGVPVRLIIDPRANATYPLNAGMLKMFQDAGIPMIKKSGSGIMHWKTMIFAAQHTVEFGSANYSPNAFVPDAPYTNYVSETVFYSDDLAVLHSFMRKYDDLWMDATNYSVYANVSGTRMRAYDLFPIIADLNFPPGQSYANRVIALEKAETLKIDIQMYRITQQAHSDALIAAHNRGVPIRYIAETLEYRNPDRMWVSWNMDRMYAAGIPMRVRNLAGQYHEKLALFYGQAITVFGSSNFTSASDNSQQEHNYFTNKNWIFLWFQDQFDRMWNNEHAGAVETKDFVPLPPGAPSYRSIANGATGVATTGQKLVWYGGLWAHYYDVYFGTTSPPTTPLATNLLLGPSETTSQTQSFALPSLQAGTTYYWKIVSKTAAYKRAGSLVSKTGPVWSFTTAGSSGGGGSLPAPWLDRDIGSVGVAGSAQFSNGTFTVRASGADIWGAADGFHYAYQPWSGDGSITARVAGVTNTSAWSKAGVMFRTSPLDAGSAHAFMLVSAANGVAFQRRAATGGTSVSTNVAGVTPPRWVRLDRSGNTFTACYSSDGTSWTLIGTDTITMPQDLFVGMAVTSHNNTTLTTATLDSVTVSQGSGCGGGGLPTPWVEQDVGSVGLAGSAQFANDTFTVKASGADIWGTADAFHYVYRQWTGDGSIVARVGSVTNTSAWAKAGVMFRETTGAGSRHAFMLLSAANGVSFQRRAAIGGTSASTSFAGVTAPRWVRLDRRGDIFTAYHSSDGTTWTQVGMDTITMPATLLVGMAVTSHNNAALTTATFTTVTAQ